MKKIYSTIMLLTMIVTALSFTACGNDDENDVGDKTSKIVGTWEIIKDLYYEQGKIDDVENGYGAYWVFTDRTVTVHDQYDYMNGKTVEYTLKGDKLYITGLELYTVVQLTSNTLVLRTLEIMGGYDVITFKRR